MKAPKKVIAAMAMVTLLGGTVAPAFADGFQASGGAVGGTPVNEINRQVEDNTKEEQSTIKVEGTFIKNVSSLPEIDLTNNGKFLRVTMPISLNYTYNVKNNDMITVPGTVTNDSAEVKGADPAQSKKGEKIPKRVKMTFVGMDDIEQGKNMRYVDKIDERDDIQLPFRLVAKRKGVEAAEISLANLVKAENNPALQKNLVIDGETSVELSIQPIGDAKVANGSELKQDTKISNTIKLKFEYLG